MRKQERYQRGRHFCSQLLKTILSEELERSTFNLGQSWVFFLIFLPSNKLHLFQKAKPCSDVVAIGRCFHWRSRGSSHPCLMADATQLSKRGGGFTLLSLSEIKCDVFRMSMQQLQFLVHLFTCDCIRRGKNEAEKFKTVLWRYTEIHFITHFSGSHRHTSMCTQRFLRSGLNCSK